MVSNDVRVFVVDGRRGRRCGDRRGRFGGVFYGVSGGQKAPKSMVKSLQASNKANAKIRVDVFMVEGIVEQNALDRHFAPPQRILIIRRRTIHVDLLSVMIVQERAKKEYSQGHDNARREYELLEIHW
jgi:hypothetical protein